MRKLIMVLVLGVLLQICRVNVEEINVAYVWHAYLGYSQFEYHSKIGLLNPQGDIAVEAVYDCIEPIPSREAWRTYKDGQVGLICINDGIPLMLSAQYDYIEPIQDDGHGYNIKSDGLYGLADDQGSVIVKPISEKTIHFSEGFAAIQQYGKGNHIKADGTFLCKEDWEGVGSFQNGLAMVKKNGKYGYINRNGHMQISNIWEEAFYFSQGIAWVSKSEDAPYYAINTQGEILFETLYYPQCDFNEYGVAVVFSEGKYGLIDTQGKLVGNMEWIMENAEFDENGFVLVGKQLADGKYKAGLINSKGELVFPLVCNSAYRYMCQFKNGVVVVYVDEDSGSLCHCYDMEGNLLSTFNSYHYDIPNWFSNEMLLITTEADEHVYIDINGHVIIGSQEEYEYWSDFSEGYAIIYHPINKKYGFIDTSGNVCISAIYDWVGSFEGGIAKVELNGVEGYIDMDGNCISGLKS